MLRLLFQAASSSWMMQLLRMKGMREDELKWLETHPDNVKEVGREMIPQSTRNRFRDYIGEDNITKMIIVRHPYTRLVSAYRCSGQM